MSSVITNIYENIRISNDGLLVDLCVETNNIFYGVECLAQKKVGGEYE